MKTKMYVSLVSNIKVIDTGESYYDVKKSFSHEPFEEVIVEFVGIEAVGDDFRFVVNYKGELVKFYLNGGNCKLAFNLVGAK